MGGKPEGSQRVGVCGRRRLQRAVRTAILQLVAVLASAGSYSRQIRSMGLFFNSINAPKKWAFQWWSFGVLTLRVTKSAMKLEVTGALPSSAVARLEKFVIVLICCKLYFSLVGFDGACGERRHELFGGSYASNALHHFLFFTASFFFGLKHLVKVINNKLATRLLRTGKSLLIELL